MFHGCVQSCCSIPGHPYHVGAKFLRFWPWAGWEITTKTTAAHDGLSEALQDPAPMIQMVSSVVKIGFLTFTIVINDPTVATF